MNYIHLKDLRNSYPVTGSADVSSYYEDKGEYIRRYGIDKNNSYIDIFTYPIDKIQTLDPIKYPYVDFSYIIQFYDDTTGLVEEWTSAPFKKLLEIAQKEKNPYFNKFSVAVIPINYGELKDHHRKNKLSIGEKYAEVEVTKTISTIEDMILHIQWLTVFTDQLRNTNSGIKIDDPKYPIDGIGSWRSVHNPKGDYGFGWSGYIKQTLKDKVFAEDITEGLVPNIIPPHKPVDAIPIKAEPTSLPAVEPPAVKASVEPPVYYNSKFNQYYPEDLPHDNNGDIIRFRSSEYNYR